jgi:hypothetical protein
MNTFITALVGTGLAGLALVLVATTVAWLEHRKRVQHLRRQRVYSANSHFALLAKTQAVDEQLLAVTAALEQEQALLSDQSDQVVQGEQAQRQSTLHSAMQRMTGETRGASHGARRQSDVAAVDGPGASKNPPSGRPRLPRALLNAAAAMGAAAAGAKEASAHWQETSPMVLANEPEHFDPTELGDEPAGMPPVLINQPTRVAETAEAASR